MAFLIQKCELGMDARRESGFTYLALLILIAIWSISLCLIAEVFEKKRRREFQQQITWEAKQYVLAIESYYYSAPPGKRDLPRKVDELLEDKRFDPPARHLRFPYSGKNKTLPLQPILVNGGLIGVQVSAPNQSNEKYVAKIQ